MKVLMSKKKNLYEEAFKKAISITPTEEIQKEQEQPQPKRVFAESPLPEWLSRVPDDIAAMFRNIREMANQYGLLREDFEEFKAYSHDRLDRVTDLEVDRDAAKEFIHSVAGEVQKLSAALAKLERKVSSTPTPAVDGIADRLDQLEKRFSSIDTTAVTLGLSARLTTLESTVKTLGKKSTPTLLAVQSPPLTPVEAPAAPISGQSSIPDRAVSSSRKTGSNAGNSRVKKTVVEGPSSSAAPPMSVPADPTTAPLSGQKTSAVAPELTYAKVAGRRSKVMSKEAISTSLDPVKDLLVQPRGEDQKTKEVLATELQAKFSQGVQKHPFAAWKSLLKGVTGKLPLSITMLSAVHCEVYWDVSASGEKARILTALRGGGFLMESVLTTTACRARRLRAYQDAYFPLLRQAALDGLTPAAQKWILDKVESKWKGSDDKIGQRLWKHRIGIDRRELGLVAPAASAPGVSASGWRNPDDVGFDSDDESDDEANTCPVPADKVESETIMGKVQTNDGASDPEEPNVLDGGGPSAMDEGEL